ncbi:hypothetical protein [Pseudoalteromonas sp. SK18]|uniref:hypothetical protein n=1 Tax=Pseudoalteromonas sp. SK18 TaxID=1938366 RepID=UPI0009758E21|nr:hypothetical protein [Pseudoalteromonas sp. SK18]
MPDHEPFISLKDAIYALLKISNFTLVRAGLQAFERGNEHPISALSEASLADLDEVADRTLIKISDLKSLGIDISNLDPFILESSDYSQVGHGTFGSSILEIQPLVKISEDELLLALPTAVSIAIRTNIIEWCDKHHYLGPLQESFNFTWVNHFSNELDVLGDLKNVSFSPIKNESKDIIGAECIVGIDDCRLIHIILVFDDFIHYENGYINSYSSFNKSNHIVSAVKKSQSFAKSHPLLEQGLSLIVGCGWGRQLAFDLDKGLQAPNWRVEVVSGPDLDTFSELSCMCVSGFWSLIEAKTKVTEAGVITQNINGLLNLYSWAKNNSGDIVPHDNLPPELAGINNFFMMIGQNELVEARWESKYDKFKQIVVDPQGNKVEVRRLNAGSYFNEDRFRPIFASVDHVNKGELLAFIDGEFTSWWCKPIIFSECNRDLYYRIWLAICNWLLKIDVAFNSKGLIFPYRYIYIDYQLSDIDVPSEFESIPSLDELKKLTSLSTQIESDIMFINISFKKGYLAGFYRLENFAESNIVSSIIDAVISSAFADSKVNLLENIFKLIIKNDYAKHVHLYSAASFIDFFKNSLPEPILQNEIDHATSKIGLGWFDIYTGKSLQLTKKTECTEYLKGLNWSLWLKIKETLAKFNKEELIKYLLLQHEAVECDTIHWQRTYPAILGLHENIEEIKSVTLDRVSSNNATLSGVRILIEMALCEASSTQKLRPNKIDTQNLIIYAIALFQFGNLSDAIHYEMVDPTIKITGLGDVHYDHSFYDKVVMPYGDRIQNKLIEQSAKKLSDQFNPSHEKKHTRIDKTYDASWCAEYGMTINDVLSILDHFEDIGLKNETPVYKIEYKHLLESISDTEIKKETFLKFINQFTLFEREKWENLPRGYKVADISPWKYKRRLSVVSKPIISIKDYYLISPSLVRKGLASLIANSFDGTYDGSFFKSKQMKSWVGEVRNKSGHAFNEQAKNEFEKLGMRALSDVNVSQILTKKTERNYGDIDVLSWNPELNTVFFVECKSLEFAKTQGEIAKQVHEFRGTSRTNGSSDRLKKHLERCDILQNNIEKVESFLKLEKIEKIYVVLLFKQVVPVHYYNSFSNLNIEMIFFEELENKISGLLKKD